MKTVTFDETKFVLVPVEPTPEMVTACIFAATASHNSLWPAKVYRAMIAATPPLAAVPKEPT